MNNLNNNLHLQSDRGMNSSKKDHGFWGRFFLIIFILFSLASIIWGVWGFYQITNDPTPSPGAGIVLFILPAPGIFWVITTIIYLLIYLDNKKSKLKTYTLRVIFTILLIATISVSYIPVISAIHSITRSLTPKTVLHQIIIDNDSVKMNTIDSYDTDTVNVGDKIEVFGFDGDVTNGQSPVTIILENTSGDKVFFNSKQRLYGGHHFSFVLKDKYCIDKSTLFGLFCDEYLEIVPGTYKVYTTTWDNDIQNVEIQVKE